MELSASNIITNRFYTSAVYLVLAGIVDLRVYDMHLI